jgi:hypothetical protein
MDPVVVINVYPPSPAGAPAGTSVATAEQATAGTETASSMPPPPPSGDTSADTAVEEPPAPPSAQDAAGPSEPGGQDIPAPPPLPDEN